MELPNIRQIHENDQSVQYHKCENNAKAFATTMQIPFPHDNPICTVDWAIPYGDETAENGAWKKGPGYKLFEVIKKELGSQAVIAEDLGFLTPSVLKLKQNPFCSKKKSIHLQYRCHVFLCTPHSYLYNYVADRAINNHPDINPETKQKILDTIQEYGYVPNDSARNLKRSDAKAIAVLIKGISNSFFTNMIQVIEKECKRKNYIMQLSHVEADEDEVNVAQKVVKEKRLRGIIFLGGLFSHSEEKLSKLNVPFVFSTVGSIPENISRNLYSSISVDDRLESAKMVEYLINSGHIRIAILVAEAQEQSISKLRLEGYYDTLKAHNIAIDPNLICHTNDALSHFSMENGYLSTKKLLARGESFTAL